MTKINLDEFLLNSERPKYIGLALILSASAIYGGNAISWKILVLSEFKKVITIILGPLVASSFVVLLIVLIQEHNSEDMN